MTEFRRDRIIKAREEDGGEKKDQDIFFEGDCDIGLKPGNGLRSPKYSVDMIKPERGNNANGTEMLEWNEMKGCID